ncbi:MAG: hypothetical protein ACOYYS_26070 [Chloroflexota bacterium]
MVKKTWMALGIFLFLLGWSALGGAPVARAQSDTPQSGEACHGCHERVYQLYDTGKSFCLCAEKMTCTCCHGGNAASAVEAEAHEGMVANPVSEEAVPCRKCHTEDAEARVEKFATMAGMRTFHAPAPSASRAAPASLEASSPARPLHWLDPWQWAGLGGLGIGMIVIVILGYRCWKADCLPKI